MTTAMEQRSALSKRREDDIFNSMNERPVDDISLEFFYKPHTIALLVISISVVLYTSFTRSDENIEDNFWAGFLCVIFFFLIISVLAFPNGPFTRPHPAVWRIVFGMSVLYCLALLFLLFQNYNTVKNIFLWLDPALKNFSIDSEKEYGVNCSEYTFQRIWSTVDVFAAGHFFGWVFKAVLVRHLGILWAMSIMWELTEMIFAHLLPNFIECWWDAWILDVLVCNGLGIYVGLWICKRLEMRDYKWASIRDIHTATGKIKRAVLQFTPSSWTPVRWLDPNCTYMRFVAICQLVIFWQVSELNTFFLKHIFEMPPSHPIVVTRLFFVGIVVAPSVRQYYTYVTDPRCLRVGTQCWVYGVIMVSESLLCIKNGRNLFGRTQVLNIMLWLFLQAIVSILFLWGISQYHKYFPKENDVSRDSSPVKSQDSDSYDETGGARRRHVTFRGQNEHERSD